MDFAGRKGIDTRSTRFHGLEFATRTKRLDGHDQ
jgi:hypothetical protein